jgi:spermidine synthase
MSAGPLFLAAYVCSGLAGLIYEVAWTRLLTLYMGHTTAAASTVVAAFMGGLAAGSAVGGRFASRLSRRQALLVYAALEGAVVLTALLLPFELAGLMSLLKWAYRDGASGLLFPSVRLVVSLIAIFVPALAMGATFPLAVRWFTLDASRPGRSAGSLYAANTAGAALGATACGFILIPSLGATGANLVGVTASAVSIAVALMIANNDRDEPSPAAAAVPAKNRKKSLVRDKEPDNPSRRWLGAVILAITGFSSLMYEIAWTRTFASLIGPSTYAFASVLAGFVSGLAIGSAAGAWTAGRVRQSAWPLACALGAAAIAGGWVSSHAGGSFARDLVYEFAQSPQFGSLLYPHALRVAVLVALPAAALGFAFPFALDLAGRRDPVLASRLGRVYALNALASVLGSIVAGFVAIPLLGLQSTLQAAGALVIAGALAVVFFGDMTRRARIAALAPAVAAAVLLVASPPWDRALLASGAYKYASQVPKDLDLETALKAGTLVYYREGATGIVSVKRLTGDLSLAIDGKVDASTTGDMLTQKLLAHVPLLIHGRARSVGIIGLGSGVTLASALTHPITSADVVEISPEVVEASHLFGEQNRRALEDPRVRLILGDGRTHLALSERQYDVIISEPSNPWMAGVAALFTREFFEAARNRLAPDGILCQWAHTYDISNDDLRSVVATFASVFPDGTIWLVGDGDLLLVGSMTSLDERLKNVTEGWRREEVSADLAPVGLRNPFGLFSLYIGGGNELRRFGGQAALQTDGRMSLEFSGPLAINTSSGAHNPAELRRLAADGKQPPAIAEAFASATARDWRDRAAMLMAASSYDSAYSDYQKAVQLDRADADAWLGFVRAAVASRRDGEAAGFLKSMIDANPKDGRPRVALSRLQAATGAVEDAIRTAVDASQIDSLDPAALDQLASLYADFGDPARLDSVVELLQRRFAGHPQTYYFAAASSFMQGRLPAALGFIKQVVAADPKRGDAYNMMGAIHASLGQLSEAKTAFLDALRLNPRDASTYTNLGLLELSAGNRPRARELFAESLSLDPASPAARQGLADSR